MSSSILLIGAGRMGGALLTGWLKSGLKSVHVVEPKPSAELRKLAKAKKISLFAAPSAVRQKPSVCVVAIKPQVLKGEAATLAAFAQNGALMISIAAGTSVAALVKAWGKKARIIRAMPNTPGAIGAGISGLYAARGVTATDRKRTVGLLSPLGQTEWVAKEELIDTVTAVSGSGPAYLFLMAEALTEAGMAEGLPRAQAEKFARATVAGAGALLAADKSPAGALREAVTSPGGTTAAALAVLTADDGLVVLMKRAVRAARKRAEELR
ncbi:MAG TPA: pyrroline-5-carboxylate reductase [Rhizomicrobium sp.]|nr:pyrroline-5-carboxylate reductase [Rhizomicrobium sp.]